MATNCVLPNHLANCHFPVLSDFLYGKAIKNPCKTKTEIFINESKPVVSVGDCAYVDVLVSRTPLLIKHIYGFIASQCYQYLCMFVDHHYDFIYVHVQKF